MIKITIQEMTIISSSGYPYYKGTLRNTTTNESYTFTMYKPSLTAYNRGDKGMKRELKKWYDENSEYFTLVDPNWLRCDNLKGGFN